MQKLIESIGSTVFFLALVIEVVLMSLIVDHLCDTFINLHSPEPVGGKGLLDNIMIILYAFLGLVVWVLGANLRNDLFEFYNRDRNQSNATQQDPSVQNQ